MYLFYIDESGNRDVGHIEQERFYVLTAVGMFEGHWKRFYLDIARPKRSIISRIEAQQGIALDFAVDAEVKSTLCGMKRRVGAIRSPCIRPTRSEWALSTNSIPSLRGVTPS